LEIISPQLEILPDAVPIVTSTSVTICFVIPQTITKSDVNNFTS